MKINMPVECWVVAPHPDDEILGCFSILTSGMKTHVSFMSNGIPGASPYLYSMDLTTRKVANHFNVTHNRERIPDSEFHNYPERMLVESLYETAKDLSPTYVFIPSFNDRNQDHLVTSKAVISALKPRKVESIKGIFGYYTPSSSEWPMGVSTAFKPTMFMPLSQKAMEDKIEAMRNLYGMQDSSRTINPEGIKASSLYYAHLGGLDGGYCEAFEIYYMSGGLISA